MVKTRQRDAELSLAHTELLRFTKYIDDSPRDWRTQKEFGPSRRPSVGASGVDPNTSYRIRQERPRVTMIRKAQ
jgi:hypothetical protein